MNAEHAVIFLFDELKHSVNKVGHLDHTTQIVT